MPRLGRRVDDERGSAAVLMSVFLASGLLFATGAVAVDLGQMYEVRREAQLAADLAATAGGGLLQTDPTKACEAALNYLREDDSFRPDETDIPPDSACSATGTSATIDSVDVDGDGSGETPVVTITGTSIRVVVPRQRVDFGFATALGISDADVTAAARVELRSYGGGIGPFAIPAGCLLAAEDAPWYFSVKDGKSTGPSDDKDSKSKGPTEEEETPDPSCTDPEEGSFGWLDIKRAGVPGDALKENVQYGADHPLAAVAGIDPTHLDKSTSETQLCDGSLELDGGGSVLYTPVKDRAAPLPLPPTAPVPNCAPIRTGNMAAVTDPLIGKKHSCTGRLNDLIGPKGTSHTRVYGDCPLNGHRLVDYLVDPTSTSLADVRNGDANVLRSDILDNPNFFVIPIVFTDVRPKTTGVGEETPIVGFRGFYLDCDEDVATCAHPFGSGPPLKELNGFVFELGTITPPPNSGDVLSRYTGSGVAVPVLVSDPLN